MSNSLSALSESVWEAIRRDDLDLALRQVHDVVERIITEPLCTSLVLGSRVLDLACQEIGTRNFAKLRSSFGKPRAEQGRARYVYVATRLQKSGGHTRVIEDFVAARPDAEHYILTSEVVGKSDLDFVRSRLTSANAKISCDAAPRKSFLDRLTWLQRRLIELRADRCYLFNHHQDSVLAAAIPPEMGLDAVFYHHGDHHFSLGVFLAHMAHIDPHPAGYHACRQAGQTRNIYVPLTLGDHGNRTTGVRFMEGGRLTTCTAARSNKIEVPYFVSYLDVIPELLRRTAGKHIHIGRLTPWALRRIRRGLERCGARPESFVYIPWVPSVWRALHAQRVDLYIASFPYGGGLTLIEAMGAGVPIALHRHMFSRVLSGIDIAYPEAFSWRAPDELLGYCADLTARELEEGARLARRQYERYHRAEMLPCYLGEAGGASPIPREPTREFIPASDEWAIWVERQVSLRHLLQRGGYRFFRAVRARFF